MAILTPSLLRETWIQGISGTAEDTVLTKVIAREEVRVANYLGYPPASAGTAPSIESKGYIRFYGAEAIEKDGRILRVDVLPLTTITSIYDDEDLDWDSDHLVAATDYSILDGSQGLILLDSDSVHGSWTEGDGNVRVAFTAGWPSVPADVQEVIGLLCKRAWVRRTTEGFESLPQGSGSASPASADHIPADLRAMLDPYRLPRAWL